MAKGLPGLVRVRAIRRVTLKELAEVIGCCKSYLIYLENGKRDCPTLTARKIALALHCDLNDLFAKIDFCPDHMVVMEELS